MVYVHRKVPCITIVQGVKFLPGINGLSDAEYNQVKDHWGFKSEISCGNMIIGSHVETETSAAVESGDVKERAARIAQEVLSMKVQEAKALILATGDGYVLRAIKQQDGRKGVQEAVDERLASIANQEGSDLKPESKVAPLGDGSDFDAKIKGTKEDVEGTRTISAIPALNGEGETF